MIARIWIAALASMAWFTSAIAEPFRFESQTSLDEMQSLARRDFSAGMSRDQVRAVFVQQGGATQIAHPTKSNIEKYLYDIDLCSYYVWRWNISADYNSKGELKQLYVNGLPTLGKAKPATPAYRGPFFQLARLRPQAFKGESSLAAIIADRDADLETRDDQVLVTGWGPTRADPVNMGRVFPYSGDVWRSIFDFDNAKAIVPFSGDCSAVDAKMAPGRR